MDMVTKQELEELKAKAENLKAKFVIAIGNKDYRQANKYVKDLGSIIKKVKKYEKQLKKN